MLLVSNIFKASASLNWDVLQSNSWKERSKEGPLKVPSRCPPSPVSLSVISLRWLVIPLSSHTSYIIWIQSVGQKRSEDLHMPTLRGRAGHLCECGCSRTVVRPGTDSRLQGCGLVISFAVMVAGRGRGIPVIPPLSFHLLLDSYY